MKTKGLAKIKELFWYSDSEPNEVLIAAIIALMTVENLFVEGLLNGSRIGWAIIMAFAMWNTVRVFKEKNERNG